MVDEYKAKVCVELSPPDVERAVKFNEVARDEAIISYKMFLGQNKLPRQVFLRGYDAIYAAAALFLSKRFKVKVDEHIGSTHMNMRLALDFYTQGTKEHQKLLDLYEKAIEKFQVLSEQYLTNAHFANKVVKDLISEGYHQGKKVNYYHEAEPQRKDPLMLDITDANKFINEIVEPFLFIIGELTNA